MTFKKLFLLPAAASPINPEPNSNMAAGSGTSGGDSRWRLLVDVKIIESKLISIL
jgi:hypothetical protein